jgi:hypothetical protein
VRKARVTARILDVLPIVVVAFSLEAVNEMVPRPSATVGYYPGSPAEKAFMLLQLCGEAVIAQSRVAIAAFVAFLVIGVFSIRTKTLIRTLAYAQVTVILACTSVVTVAYVIDEALRAQEPFADHYVYTSTVK